MTPTRCVALIQVDRRVVFAVSAVTGHRPQRPVRQRAGVLNNFAVTLIAEYLHAGSKVLGFVGESTLPPRFGIVELGVHFTIIPTHRVDVLYVAHRPFSRLIVEQLCLLETLCNYRCCRMTRLKGNSLPGLIKVEKLVGTYFSKIK
tara:strand:- start:461 stop:898 length:438 start_codon:yes stop_codon:yes gene_type:complete